MKISASIFEEFEKFLIEKNAFSQFITNLQEQVHISFDEYPDYIEEMFPLITKPIYLIFGLVSIPFNWNHTKEGYNYWIDIDIRWREKSGNFLKNS